MLVVIEFSMVYVGGTSTLTSLITLIDKHTHASKLLLSSMLSPLPGFLLLLVRISRWCSGKESAFQCKRWEFDPWLGRSPGVGNGNPIQYFCLENPVDREAWQATVHGMAKSWTRQTHSLPWAISAVASLNIFVNGKDSWIQPPFSHKPYLFFIHLFSQINYKEDGKLLTWQHPTVK